MRRDEGLHERTRRFFQEVWNEQNDDAVSEFLSPQLKEHGLSVINPIALGMEDFLDFRRQFLTAFPDARFTIEQVVVEGDRTAVRYYVEATHTGEWLGLPATGRRVMFTAMGVGRWEDGKLVEAWNNFDQLGLLRQLGMAD